MIICGALNLAYYSIERKKLVNLPESLLKSEKVEDHTNVKLIINFNIII